MRWLIVFFISVASCANNDKKFSEDLAKGRCDEALLNLPQRDPLVKLANSSQQSAGTVLSYAFVGASYTAELLWDVAGGTVMTIALCGPIVAASAAGNFYSSDQQARPILCLPGSFTALSAPPLGRKALKNTQAMRCPDLTSLSRSLRAVSACYEARGGADNLAKAKSNLDALKAAKDFYACMPSEEHNLLNQQLAAIESKRGLAH